MCDPITIGITSIALTAVGTGVAAYGQIQQGKAAETQSIVQGNQAQINSSNIVMQTVLQRQALDENRDLALRAAKDSRERGQTAEVAHRLKVGQLASRQTAVMAASGIELGFGSALDILGDTADLGELDALTIRANAEEEAQRHLAQGRLFAIEEKAARQRGEQAQAGGTFAESAYRVAGAGQREAATVGAMSTLLTGAGSVADKWYKMR